MSSATSRASAEKCQGPESQLAFAGTVIEASTEHSIIATDPGGKILLWNAGAERLYGYASGEMIGQSLDVLRTKDVVKDGVPETMVAAAARDGKCHRVAQRIRKDGSTFTADLTVTPRRESTGDAGGFLHISTDVTEDVRLSQELNTVAELALERDRCPDQSRQAVAIRPSSVSSGLRLISTGNSSPFLRLGRPAPL